MPNVVHNERVKLIANAFDRASTGCFATGVFAPTVALMLGSMPAPANGFIIAVVFWSLGGLALHIEAQRNLAALRE